MKLFNPSGAPLLKQIKDNSSKYWEEIQHKNSLDLFQKAAHKVPAYKQFLRENKINPNSIKTWQDFKLVPPVNKDNYLRKYSLKDLSWDGSLDKPLVFTATSGSSGEPVYFMRDDLLDWQYSVLLEEYLENGNIAKNGPTLVLICFAMGIWIAGVITYKALDLASKRNNYPLSILTPGINKRDIFNALKKLSPNFNQTILVGYPPFIRDILDEAYLHDINLQDLKLRVFFAAESIGEKFRDFVSKKAHIKNKYLDTMNIYGSADIGALAVEYTTSIFAKRLAKKNKSIFQDIFSPINKTPTLAQYNPLFTNFESENGEILLTGNNTTPLIRYSIGDQGGVLTYDELIAKFSKHKIDFNKEAQKSGLNKYITKLPFVYVYERSDFSTSFYGLLIYPEWMKTALLEKPLDTYLTGKFTLTTEHDKDLNQILEVHLELQKNRTISRSIRQITLNKIVNHLRSNSSEYREITNQMKKRGYPKLHFWPYEHELYFKPGTKQKWVLKTA